MDTIGQILKKARTRRRYSREKLEKITKIKKSFIEAIEKEDWQNLPEYPVVQGFVKSIALTLNLDRKQAIALLRRDFPPKKLNVNPKPDISEKFNWSPKLTFFVGAVFVTVLVFVYLGFQYINFISPPKLEVLKPSDGEVITKKTLLVTGKTDADAVIRVNNQPVLVDDEGLFSSELEIYEGTGEIEVKAISRSGKETTIKRKIIPRLE